MADDLFGSFFQATVPPLPKSLTFAGKTAIVTGATAGLGNAAALQIAQHNVSTLILGVRSLSKGETTKAEILADPVVAALPTKPSILLYELDLARPSSVASFASKILAEVPTLDILLLNAALAISTFERSPETENELMTQVNYLSNAYLSVRLFPLLHSTAQKAGTKSYLTIVGSRLQDTTDFVKNPVPESTPILEYLNNPKKFKLTTRYSDTKVLVAMFVRELAKRVDPSVVTVNTVCPGLVSTGINSNQPAWLRAVAGTIMALRARTPEVGARTLVNAVSAGPESHGEHLGDYKIWNNKFLNTQNGTSMVTRLWKETLAAIEKEAPGSVQAAGLEA
ncbi:hypothetical protein FB45DRAFT_904644 [Roridomyces roridus]|uniref:Uncharacterized protein n=1 Tax=Roridomyces roridus TaxID=1738132 RepID=A0AAD7FRS8_9AGAR|nr:hypothetical protein FB45DRAFT_904644 [Roridomyces roridus]